MLKKKKRRCRTSKQQANFSIAPGNSGIYKTAPSKNMSSVCMCSVETAKYIHKKETITHSFKK
ncbi:UNVERIFIED_CONTAM: hypothetical protein FKN15_043651 [Acipenser sinensis]